MSTTVRWAGTVTARSSIVHGGEARGPVTLLRRERVLGADGAEVLVPVVSGNAVRGRLRRIGEELLREVVQYEGVLSLSAAHALRGGGALAKVSGEPLTGARLARVRALVPPVAVFGCAAGGRVISGALQVGRLMPCVAEVAHLTGRSGPSMFTATQLETYTRVDEAASGSLDELVAAGVVPVVDEETAAPAGRGPSPTGSTAVDDGMSGGVSDRRAPGPMVFRVETFPAGTRFASWLQLERASPLAVAFFTDVLAVFAESGRVGGRGGVGHGQVSGQWERTEWPAPAPVVDWRAHLHARRDQVLEALALLT